MLRVLAAPSFFGAYRALPWVALGWAMYGLWVVFLVIARRAKQLFQCLSQWNALGRAGDQGVRVEQSCPARGRLQHKILLCLLFKVLSDFCQ